MSINLYNSNFSNKNKWINEYKKLSISLKEEELNLLKFFLINNYHLNKAYKKYVYKEMISNNSYYNNYNEKIKSYLNEFLSFYSSSSKSIDTKQNSNYNFNNNTDHIFKKQKIIQDLISSIKKESNKRYELLLKEESEIKNDLKKFDPSALSEYDKEIEDWLNEYSNSNNNIINTENNIENNKEDIFTISNMTGREKEKNRLINNIKTFKSQNNSIHNIDLSSKINDNFLGNTKSIKSLLGNLNIKKKKESVIKLTTSQINKNFLEIINNSQDSINKYIDLLLKDIDNPSNFISNLNINNKDPQESTSSFNIINEEKEMINNINIFLSQMNDDYKNINYLKTKIKYINNVIKDKMGGIYLGWAESAHNEFVTLKNKFKDKSNSFIFLTSLNNLFPYMNVSDLKKHIKLYDIYLKIEKIKKLLIDKYTQMINKLDIEKSRISKQSSSSVTKSNYSVMPKFTNLKGNNLKLSYFNNKIKFFDYSKREIYKSDAYLRMNFYKNLKINKHKKKEKYLKNNNLSALLIKHSKDKDLNYSFNNNKKSKLKNLFEMFNIKKGKHN